jgi:hypothetical protein
MRRDLEIHHATGLDKTKSNERNMRILEHLDRMASHTKFYLHYENFIHGNKEKSARYGSEALAMQDLDGVHRYETLINCATLTYPETAIRLLGQAQKLEPNRREAFALEANILLDNEKYKEAMEVIEKMGLIPIPKFTQWTHQAEWYGWKADLLKAWTLRLLDRSQEADKIEDEMRRKSNLPTISIIHATRGRPIEAVKTMNLWLSRAKNPERIEYIFICDDDDEVSKKVLKRFNLKIQKENGYSVGAWNLAARESSGELIIQMSDDWECPPMWDELIEQRIDYTQAQVLRVSDGHRTDDLLGIAILTREYYERYGLFNGIFKNVYSDTDFTFRAEKNHAIINARDITIIHHHPFWENRELDETYQRGNDLKEYERAKAIFERLHE